MNDAEVTVEEKQNPVKSFSYKNIYKYI